ncbi:putrescine oxidase [Mycobacteroides abscessus subsp. abscessus]|nr:putrescine oxidase [Mycobacteroides abscessus subsp. abscessus]
MIASAGKFEHLIDEGILLDERVAGGMQSVSQQIADELGPDVVHLSTRVRHLAWSDAGDGSPSIVAAVSDQVTVRARCAVAW